MMHRMNKKIRNLLRKTEPIKNNQITKKALNENLELKNTMSEIKLLDRLQS